MRLLRCEATIGQATASLQLSLGQLEHLHIDHAALSQRRDPLQDEGLVEVLGKMDKALSDIRIEYKDHEAKIEHLKGEFESSLLESEEFKSACKQQLASITLRTSSTATHPQDLRAISTDGHARDGKPRIHKITHGSTSGPRVLWQTDCGWNFGKSSTCRISTSSKPVEQEDGLPCTRCFPEFKHRRASTARRDEQGANGNRIRF